VVRENAFNHENMNVKTIKFMTLNKSRGVTEFVSLPSEVAESVVEGWMIYRTEQLLNLLKALSEGAAPGKDAENLKVKKQKKQLLI